MNVLVADKFETIGLNGLKALGVKVDYQPDLKDATLVEAIKSTNAEVLVVRSTKVTVEMMADSQLCLIVRAGAGYNTIDVAAASENGIFVANCPGKNSQAVAELAFGLMIAADRHIANCAIDLAAGKWNKKAYSKAGGLFGRTLGLIGMGAIGKEMIVRARAFGMSVRVFSRWMPDEVAAELGVEKATSLLDLAKTCDIVSIHTSLTPETRGMLGTDFFSAMKSGAIFINTSRAEVVDDAAMLAELQTGRISAGLDVFAGEPDTAEAECSTPYATLPNVIVTHHIGASTEQAQEAVAAETVRIIAEFNSTGDVPSAVNLNKPVPGTHALVVRHADKVGVLAHVLSVLKDEGVSVQEMQNIVLQGAKAAVAQITLDKTVTADAIRRIQANENIFGASVVEAGSSNQM